MSSEWQRITFGEFISLQRGHDLPEQEREDGGVPILGSFGITGLHSTAKAKAPGLAIGRSGASFGVATYTDKDYFPLNTTLYVTDFNGNHPRFAYYFAKDFDFSAFNSGSAQPSLNRNFINPVKVSIPPIAEQKAIAHILGTLDDKIELNRKTNETLEAMARALFKSWFVDFDPVRAKAEGRPTGLPDGISDLFPDSFQDSKLGEIPRGWGVKALDQVAHFLNGLALQRFPPADDSPTLPVIKIAQLKKGDALGADRCSISVPEHYVIRDGDVLFSWSGSLAVDVWCGGDGALNQHLFKVTSKNYGKWFFYQWVKHHLPDFQEIAQSKATTMGHIQRHHLSEAQA